jgi:hypothetical protein
MEIPVYTIPLESFLKRRSTLQPSDPAYEKLMKTARKFLKREPQSVMDKSLVAASGDKHDYLSFAPYWWPDPSKPNGLPYIRKDGKRNPDIKVGTDNSAFIQTCDAIFTLGLAFYLTNDGKYAEKAATVIRVWFLDPKTRMNPHLKYAKAVRGLNDGRFLGILDGRILTSVCDGIAFISKSPAWTEQDSEGFKAWMNEYYHWLTRTDAGAEEKAHPNNHGTWYDVQAAHLALFLGKPEEAFTLVETAKQRRIDRQIERDGTQPHEMQRTKSLNYSIFNLEALTRLAILGEWQ